MITREENEEQEGREFLEEFLEIYSQLSSWERFQVDLYIHWSGLQRRLRKILWDWLMLQWHLDEKINEHRKSAIFYRSPY